LQSNAADNFELYVGVFGENNFCQIIDDFCQIIA
jgi:hypothetical protein